MPRLTVKNDTTLEDIGNHVVALGFLAAAAHGQNKVVEPSDAALCAENVINSFTLLFKERSVVDAASKVALGVAIDHLAAIDDDNTPEFVNPEDENVKLAFHLDRTVPDERVVNVVIPNFRSKLSDPGQAMVLTQGAADILTACGLSSETLERFRFSEDMLAGLPDISQSLVKLGKYASESFGYSILAGCPD